MPRGLGEYIVVSEINRVLGSRGSARPVGGLVEIVLVDPGGYDALEELCGGLAAVSIGSGYVDAVCAEKNMLFRIRVLGDEYSLVRAVPASLISKLASAEASV